MRLSAVITGFCEEKSTLCLCCWWGPEPRDQPWLIMTVFCPSGAVGDLTCSFVCHQNRDPTLKLFPLHGNDGQALKKSLSKYIYEINLIKKKKTFDFDKGTDWTVRTSNNLTVHPIFVATQLILMWKNVSVSPKHLELKFSSQQPAHVFFFFIPGAPTPGLACVRSASLRPGL